MTERPTEDLRSAAQREYPELRGQDVEPETARAQSSTFLNDPNFTWPERVPWSELGPDFIGIWGRADESNPQPEHLEIVGPTGSGKTHLMLTMLQDRYRARKTGAILVVTKADDAVFGKLGWPVVSKADEIRDTNVVFWPRTKKTGTERRAFHDRAVSSLLNRLWQPGANTIVAFDEVGYIESLSGEMRALVQMYWREARSVGITVVAMKQRPQGALRDMHSETYWTAAFAPKDRSDAERFAELFGHRRDWLPVFDSLDPDLHEFILRHSRSREAYISWVDTPLTPQKIKRQGLSRIVGR
jgi:nucleoside-triphosphatase THEP1